MVSMKFSLICSAISQFSRNLRDRRTLLAGKDRSDNDRMSEISTMKTNRCKDASTGRGGTLGTRLTKTGLVGLSDTTKEMNFSVGVTGYFFPSALRASLMLQRLRRCSLSTLSLEF